MSAGFLFYLTVLLAVVSARDNHDLLQSSLDPGVVDQVIRTAVDTVRAGGPREDVARRAALAAVGSVKQTFEIGRSVGILPNGVSATDGTSILGSRALPEWQGIEPLVNLSEVETVTYSNGATLAFLDDLDLVLDVTPPRSAMFGIAKTAKIFKKEEKEELVRQSPSSDTLLESFSECSITRLQQFDHLCTVFVLPEKGVLNTHVYKNGGSSTCRAFQGHGGRSFQHGTYSVEALEGMIHDDRWFRTALVRDPLKRALSAYHEIKVRQCEMDANACSQSSSALLADFADVMTKFKTSENPEEHTTHGFHLLTQTHFMVNSQGVKYQFDYIGNADNLQEELTFISGSDGLQLEELHGPDEKGLSANVPRIAPSDLTAELTQLVCDIYRDDYCCFGFEFPEACNATVSCGDRRRRASRRRKMGVSLRNELHEFGTREVREAAGTAGTVVEFNRVREW